VIAATLTRPEVDVFRPGVVVAAGVREDRQGVPQAFVAGPSEGRHLTLSRLLRHGAHPRVGGQRLGARVALASVADLGEELGGGERRAGVAEEREEDPSVGMGAYGVGNPRISSVRICSTRGLRTATSESTAVLRVSSSALSARPSGAQRSLASNSAAGFSLRNGHGGRGSWRGASRPALGRLWGSGSARGRPVRWARRSCRRRARHPPRTPPVRRGGSWSTRPWSARGLRG
jgi:hypothetical protein